MSPNKSKDFEGFYEIPNFSKYCIDKNSNILHKRKNIIINQYDVYGSETINKEHGCYKRVTMYNDNGVQAAITVHRLMGLTFLYEKGCEKLQINHKNMIKNDNRIENLEWVDCITNIRHSKKYGHKRKFIKVQLKSVKTGEVINFNNISEAGKFLGLHRTTILSRLNKFHEKYVFPEGYMMRYGSSSREWEIPEDFHDDIETFHTQPLLCKNVLSNEILEFKNLLDCAKFINKSLSYTSVYSTDVTQPLINRGKDYFIVIKKYPYREFRVVKDIYLDLALNKVGRRVVLVINTITGKRKIYSSLQACADDFNLKKNTLCHRLKAKKIRVYNGYIFQYYQEGRTLGN